MRFLLVANPKLLPVATPPVGREHQTCHPANTTASAVSTRHTQACLVKSEGLWDWIGLIRLGAPLADPSRNATHGGGVEGGPAGCVRGWLPVCCEILIELLMTPRSDTTHEKLPRISQEEPFFLLLQNRRHWEIDKSKRRGQGSN